MHQWHLEYFGHAGGQTVGLGLSACSYMPVGGVELCSIRFRPVRSKSESDRIYIWTNVNTIIQLGDHIYKKRRIICALVDHYCVEGLGGHLVFRHHSSAEQCH